VFSPTIPHDREALAKLLSKFDIQICLHNCKLAFESLDAFDGKSAEQLVHEFATKRTVNTGECIRSVRLAVPGCTVGPSRFALLRVLRKEVIPERLNIFASQS
jgi:glutamyl/glutaminyl-tRNA synthetase